MILDCHHVTSINRISAHLLADLARDLKSRGCDVFFTHTSRNGRSLSGSAFGAVAAADVAAALPLNGVFLLGALTSSILGTALMSLICCVWILAPMYLSFGSLYRRSNVLPAFFCSTLCIAK